MFLYTYIHTYIRGNPQNVQASVQGGCFGRGYTAPVPGLSSPPQACAGLMVAQAHHNQQKSKVCRGRHRPKTIFMSVGSLRGGSRSVLFGVPRKNLHLSLQAHGADHLLSSQHERCFSACRTAVRRYLRPARAGSAAATTLSAPVLLHVSSASTQLGAHRRPARTRRRRQD